MVIVFDCNFAGMDYKRFYERCNARYPIIVEELLPEPAIKDLSELPQWLVRFGATSGVNMYQVLANESEARTLFCAVTAKMVDPAYFNFAGYASHRLIQSLARTVGCTDSQIKFSMKKARNFMAVYPEFKQKVEEIYEAVRN